MKLFNLTNDFNVFDANVKMNTMLESCIKILKLIVDIKDRIRIPKVLLQSDDAGDRCAFICAIIILLNQIMDTYKVDIFQTIRKLRHTRANLISTFVSINFFNYRLFNFLFYYMVFFFLSKVTNFYTRYLLNILITKLQMTIQILKATN